MSFLNLHFSSLRPHPSKRSAFPLFELFISAGLFILIVAGLYFFGGAWGVVLLWGLGVFFLLPLTVAPFGMFELGRQKIAARRWPVAAAYLLGALLIGAAWLAAAGYCGYRAYLAIP